MPDVKILPKGTQNYGYQPIEKGWKPAVQGGYKPTTSHVVASPPPSGGSGVKPPVASKP
jgi:hypothetical protein